jgi:hypothetical protein
MQHKVDYCGGSIGFRTKREADKFRREEADARAFGLQRSATADKHMRDVKQFTTPLQHDENGLPF